MTPVKVAGSTVARATLHNLDEVRRKDIRIGDYVVLQKAGDVIPEVVRPIVERRTGTEREFEMPRTCPVCGTPVVRDEGAVRHYCPNTLCPARVGQEFGHFAGRGGMDIEGAGWMVLTQLLQRGLVKTRGDFFRLTVDDLSRSTGSPGRAPRTSTRTSRRRGSGRSPGSSTRWASRRSASRRPSTWPTGSRPVATRRRRADGRPGWLVRPRHARAARPPAEEFQQVMGIGPTVAASVARWFEDPATAGILDDLVDAGVEPVRRPTAAIDADGRRAAPRQDARGHGHARRASTDRAPRRRSGPRAGRRRARCRRRPTTWSRARTPAPSWPRRRSWA